MKAKKFASIKDMDWEPGSYFLANHNNKQYPFMVLPCGDNFMPDDRWGMENTDDEEKITITPSILCGGSSKKCGWHGFLTNGEFKVA